MLPERRVDARVLALEPIGPSGFSEEWDVPRFLEDGSPSKVDREGNPLSLREWTAAFESQGPNGTWRGSYRDVAYADVGDELFVWASWGGLTGPRGVYEITIWRKRPDSTSDVLLERAQADDEAEALKWHKSFVGRAERGEFFEE